MFGCSVIKLKEKSSKNELTDIFNWFEFYEFLNQIDKVSFFFILIDTVNYKLVLFQIDVNWKGSKQNVLIIIVFL